jgi:hypothetical protein
MSSRDPRDVSAWIGDDGLPKVGKIAGATVGALLLSIVTGITELLSSPGRAIESFATFVSIGIAGGISKIGESVRSFSSGISSIEAGAVSLPLNVLLIVFGTFVIVKIVREGI